MHPSMKLLLDDLVKLGFRKRTGLILTLDLGGGWLGWLGLNTASRTGMPGDLLVNPVVGIRCQTVELTVAQGRGVRAHAYIPPTVSEPLRYLVPVASRRHWMFHDGEQLSEGQVDDLVAAVRQYGLPLIHELRSMDAVIARLRRVGSLDDQAACRWLAALRISGNLQGLTDAVEQVRSNLGSRSDVAARELREFVAWVEGDEGRV